MIARHLSRLILLPMLITLLCSTAASGENIVFPEDAHVINVKLKFGAKGDGVSDDTEAIRQAIEKHKGTPTTLYFPNGTYLVSDTMNVGDTPHSRDRFLVFQGQSEAGTIIKLRDIAPGYDDAENPKLVLSLYDGTSTCCASSPLRASTMSRL